MEAAGLAIGIVGLAALFSSCKDFLDLIEVSRTSLRSSEILDTKYEAQKLRLQIWGQAVGLIGDLPYDKSLDHEAVRPTVERILNNIRLLFLDTDRLRHNYGLRRVDDKAIGSQPAQRWRDSFLRFQQRLSRSQDASRALRRVKWAVIKRDQFENLLRDLKDYIDGLESISSSLEQLSRRRNILENDIQSAPSERSLRILQEVTEESRVIISDSASSRFLLLENNTTSHNDNSIVQTGQATSIHETYFTTLSHQVEDTLVLDQAVVETGSMVIPETPQNQRIVSSTVGTVSASTRESSSRDSFSEEEIFAQTRKFFEIKTGDKNVRSNGTAGFSNPQSLLYPSTLYKGLERVFNNSSTQISFHIIDDNLTDLLGVFLGPKNSPYQGGIFFTRWAIPNDYPLGPPTIKFLTKVYHPNIDPRGRICADFLAQNHSPAYKLLSLHVALMSLLDSPGVEDPLVPEIAQQYIANRNEYDSIARLYTKKYATGEMPQIEPLHSESPWWKELQEWTLALGR